jgi:hypothetical protein
MKQSRNCLLCLLAIIVLIALASQSCFTQAPAQQPKARTAPASSGVSGFTVKLTLSDKASATLTSRSETIIVAGYLTGFAKQGTPKRYKYEESVVSLGQVKDEIVPGGVATFERVRLDPAALKWVDSQGPQLLNNVYSGRKSTHNNLLDCGIYEGPLQAVQGQNIALSCKLIGE